MDVNEIRNAIPETELLAGLAEEAAELAQAALKLRRAIDETNPTMTSMMEALNNLYEETADVKLYLDVLRINHINGEKIQEIEDFKLKRWISRLEKKERV